MSTVSPETVRQIARRAEAISAAFVDAPLSGSVGPAKEGKLLILAGGRAEDVERARPVLSVFSRRLEHVGLVGAGAAMKIAIQLPISVYWQAIAESLSIGRRLGLDVGQMLELIADSPAALAMLGGKIPTILEQERGVAFDLASARKDLSVMSRTADSLQVPAPVVDAALMRYAAAVEGGWGARDIACIATFSLQADPQDRDAPA
jgi:3-hydroxyisobutyrate dehydrogenase-like beta-hydroxyacid dehydrogenase